MGGDYIKMYKLQPAYEFACFEVCFRFVEPLLFSEFFFGVLPCDALLLNGSFSDFCETGYHSRPKKEKFGGGLLRFIDFLESVFYGGRAVIDFPVSAKILIILR